MVLDNIRRGTNAQAHPLRTLLVSDIFPPKTGGSARWFWEIYQRMPRENYLIAAGEDRRQEAFDQTHDLRVVRMPLSLGSWGIRSVDGLLGYRRAVWQLRKLVKAEQIDMLHCARCLPEGVMALALKFWNKVPYACYVHGEDINCASTSRELSWLVRKVLRGAEFVIANSRNTAQLLRNSWELPERQIELLYPGVDTKRFVPAGRDEAVRRELGWGSRPVILTVGRLQKRKGHDHMIRALRAVKQVIPNILYGIIGEGEERDCLQELAAREGVDEQVQFLGDVDDDQLVRCYQQCDLFILPNRQVGADIEGFGMVLLEAQACGKPVVAGASGGTAETMSIPQTGRVICCEEPQRLAVLVIELLRNRAQIERMGALARQWVVEHFDWSAISNRAGLIFQRLYADHNLSVSFDPLIL